MRASTAVYLVALAGAGSSVPGILAPQTLPTPRQITRLGSSKAYGPGIIGASISQIWFELTRAAHVIVLRVDPGGGIEVIVPQAGGSPTERTLGVHTIEAPLPEQATEPQQEPQLDPARLLDPVVRSPGELARKGRRAFPPAAGSNDSADAATAHYWLVIVTDTAVSADELQSGLAAMQTQAFTRVEAAVRALPREVVRKRARRWAAYYALVQR